MIAGGDTIPGMQSVWVIAYSPAGWKTADMTGNPQAAALNVPNVGGSKSSPTMVGAIIEATREANAQGRRITAVTRIEQEAVLIVD